MKYFTLLRPLGLKIRLMLFLLLLFGMHAPAFGQTIGDRPDRKDYAAVAEYEAAVDEYNAEVAEFWGYWMVSPTVTGPRFYLSTERDVLQSSWSNASFQRGSLSMVVADGSVGAVWGESDSDKDGWRDSVELAADPATLIDDPLSFPTVGAPDVFWTTLANGAQLPVDLAGSTPAARIRAFSYPYVSLTSAPPLSTLARPLVFNDYSTQFYIVNPETSVFELFSQSLYNYSKVYPNPGDVGEMETDLVEGVYQVEFPTVSNPYAREGISAVHNLMPNGAFTIGVYKKPTWLLRSVESLERLDEAPVPQDWVNGRLRFDPNVATTFKWDNLITKGLANGVSDKMTVKIEFDDEDEPMSWPPTDAGVPLSMAVSKVTLKMDGLIGIPLVGVPPVSRNGFMVFQYSRDVNIGASGDRSTVTLRVPIEMRRSYASYRLLRWPGLDSLDDSISGPNADPDGDGVPNFVEFENGLDPLDAFTFPPFPDSVSVTLSDPNADTDGDGVPNGVELENDLDRLSAISSIDDDDDPATPDILVRDAFWLDDDTDGDTIPDWLEDVLGFDSNLVDSDGDGLNDALEDRDSDGLYDHNEYRGFALTPGEDPTDLATIVIRTNLAQVDSDGDGLLDSVEYFVTGTNPSAADADADGLNDLEELQAGSDPTLADTDGDSLLDGEEVNLFGTSPILEDTDGDGIFDADEDTDRDLLTNRQERDITRFTDSTYDPHSDDSDGDGVPDGEEDADGDGLTNLMELTMFIDPATGEPVYSPFRVDSDWVLVSKDTNGDGDVNSLDEDLTMLPGFLFEGVDDGFVADDFAVFDGVLVTKDTNGDGVVDALDGDLTMLPGFIAANFAADFAVFGELVSKDTNGDGIVNAADDDLTILPGFFYEGSDFAVFGVELVSMDTNNDGVVDAADADLTILLGFLFDGSDFAVFDRNAGVTDNNEDFDGDGLSNGDELFVYGYDPTRDDTFNDGIMDGDRDPDGDRLGIIDELRVTLTDPLNPDSDGDGVTDDLEDPDGDLLINYDEVNGLLVYPPTNPLSSDTDLDGISDGVEVFVTLSNPTLLDTDGNGTTDYFEDADGDFLPDGYEVNIYSGTLEALIFNRQSAFRGPDSDGDGLLDIHEQLLTGTDFGNPDTDGDGTLDGAEDFDGDGLTNAQELPASGQITAGNELYLGGTNPMISDTDGDGLSDGDEINTHLTNPLDIDSDDDGFRDNVEIAAQRNPNNNADFPVDQLITQPRVRSFPVAPGTPPGGTGFLVEAERLAASAPVGGVRYEYVFQGSTDVQNWANLPTTDWIFTNVDPADTGNPTATYTGPGTLPAVNFFRILALPRSITP